MCYPVLKIPVRIRIKKKEDQKSRIDFTVNDSRVLFKTAWDREVDIRKLIELDLLQPELFLSYWNGELERFNLEESIKGKLLDIFQLNLFLYLELAETLVNN